MHGGNLDLRLWGPAHQCNRSDLDTAESIHRGRVGLLEYRRIELRTTCLHSSAAPLGPGKTARRPTAARHMARQMAGGCSKPAEPFLSLQIPSLNDLMLASCRSATKTPLSSPDCGDPRKGFEPLHLCSSTPRLHEGASIS